MADTHYEADPVGRRRRARHGRARGHSAAEIAIWTLVVALCVLAAGVTGVLVSARNGAAKGGDAPLPSAGASATSSVAEAVASVAPTVVETEPTPPVPEPVGPASLPPIRPRVVKSVPSAGRRVALTFDLCERDGDLAGYDAKLVSILEDTETKATFFMGGKWAESHPEAAAHLGAQPGFEIANHSWSHKALEKADAATVDAQVNDAQDAIYRFTGRTPRLFRFPFGTYDKAALRTVGDAGLVTIQWSVVTGDPDPHIDAADIKRAVRQRTHPGSVIIMHANGRGWHTAEALPGVITYLRGKGYELVTVSELLEAGE